MQSKATIYFFGMRNDHNLQAKDLWRILILLWQMSFSFCDTYLYTANKSVKLARANKTFIVSTLKEM